MGKLWIPVVVVAVAVGIAFYSGGFDGLSLPEMDVSVVQRDVETSAAAASDLPATGSPKTATVAQATPTARPEPPAPTVADETAADERSNAQTTPTPTTAPPAEQSAPKRENAAIVFLVNTKRGMCFRNLEKSLPLLDKNFNDQFHYPVFIYYDEPDFERPERQAKVRALTRSTITFVRVADFLDLPKGFALTDASEWASNIQLGYRQMCRFWFKKIFHRPELAHIDYYWRFDDDSFLLEPVKYDVFELMRKGGIRYGYRSDGFKEQKLVIEGLWRVIAAYAKKKKLKFKQEPVEDLSRLMAAKPSERDRLADVLPMRIYYNNFEIVDANYWRNNKDIMDFTDHIDSTHGTLKYRWGDAPLRWVTVQMFLTKKQIHCFSDMDYHHKVFMRARNCREFTNDDPKNPKPKKP